MNWQSSPLAQSTAFGFLDQNSTYSNQVFNPSLIFNNDEHTMLAAIREELRRCNHFTFSVAFISSSALAMLKQELLNYQGTGRIITSNYLDFNEPEVFEELLQLDQFEVLVHSDPAAGFHAKGYVFHHDDGVTAIVGSSNLTERALNCNHEWNLKFSAFPDGDIAVQLSEAISEQAKSTVPLTQDWIKNYEANRKIRKFVLAPEDGSLLPEKGIIVPNAMQSEALSELQKIQSAGENRAVIISATGTGKTILAALAAKQAGPKKLLFVVHREQILSKAMSEFQRVLGGSPQNYGRIVGKDLQTDRQFLFATIQSLSRDFVLEKLPPDLFDYIIVDEVHRIGASTYQKVVDHFNPEFLLGLTATPERSDDFNVFELFDYNVPYEIRLQAALEAEMLVPFHYYGVTDYVNSDMKVVDETSSLSRLVAPERVKYVLEMIYKYGHPRDAKGLIFCSRKEEAHELSRLLNERSLYGKQLRTLPLDGSTPMEQREAAVRQLEAGELDYLLTVDIFNEGIDIPAVNQIVMLRNTQSSIIFTQQLGRGLRKFAGKDHLRVIDFIGNYKNNYLIPIALFGENSRNKERIRKHLIDNKRDNSIAGISSVSFDEISQERVLDSIQTAKIDSIANLKQDIQRMQHMLGRVPKLIDFATRDAADPKLLATKDNNYWSLLKKTKFVDDSPSEIEAQFLNFLSSEVLEAKRPHELLLLNLLLERGMVPEKEFIQELLRQGTSTDASLLSGIERVLSLEFYTSQQAKKFGTNPIVTEKDGIYRLAPEFESLYRSTQTPFAYYVDDIVETGLFVSRHQGFWSGNLEIGKRYTRREVCRLLNFNSNQESTLYGYKTDDATRTCPIFVTYHKLDDITDSTKYEDEFLDPQTLRWFTRSKRNLASAEVKKIIEDNYPIFVFVKKSDAEGTDFIYLGRATHSNVVQQQMPGGNGAMLDVVQMDLRLEQPVNENLFNYLRSNLVDKI